MNKQSAQMIRVKFHRRIISNPDQKHIKLNISKILFWNKNTPLKQDNLIVSARQKGTKSTRCFSSRISSSSCHCQECGGQSKFAQQIFKLYSFESNFNRKRGIRRKFRRFIFCILFIIRYKIVQKIRERQRNKMKKVINTTVHIHKPSAISNLIAEGIKQMKQQKLIHQQQDNTVQEEHDSDEEFYHFKPKLMQGRKSLAPLLTSPKSHKNLLKSYLEHQFNRPISQFIAKRSVPSTTHCSPESHLPKLNSLYEFNNLISIRRRKKNN